MNDYAFRPYDKGDFEDCTDLSLEAWPVVSDFGDNESARGLVKAYVTNNLCTANYAEVCCDKDKVIGFLIGHVKHFNGLHIENSGNAKLFFNYLFGKYGKVRKRLQLLFSQMWATAKTEHICRRFDGEILLFVVSSDYRGKGIGKQLMHNYLNFAKSNHSNSVFLATDAMCNWVFYEKIGFIKYKEYYDESLSILMHKKANSSIYYLELNGEIFI